MDAPNSGDFTGLVPLSFIILLVTFFWEIYKSLQPANEKSSTEEAGLSSTTRRTQNWILTAILGIASLFYFLIFRTPDPQSRVVYRYADWLPTTTLLVYNYWSLGTAYGWNGPPVLLLLVLNFFMIGLGYMTFIDPANETIYNVLSFGCLFIILWYFHDMSQYMRRIANERNDPQALRIADAIWFFYAWPLYGIVHQFPSQHDNGYAVLDVFTKAGYSAFLNL